MTHVLSNHLKPTNLPFSIKLQNIDYTNKSLLDAASFIDDAIKQNGIILVYDASQRLAWGAVCAYCEYLRLRGYSELSETQSWRH